MDQDISGDTHHSQNVVLKAIIGHHAGSPVIETCDAKKLSSTRCFRRELPTDCPTFCGRSERSAPT
jgi:hypothetical protein